MPIPSLPANPMKLSNLQEKTTITNIASSIQWLRKAKRGSSGAFGWGFHIQMLLRLIYLANGMLLFCACVRFLFPLMQVKYSVTATFCREYLLLPAWRRS